jgi:hypothetical protein
MGQNRTLKRIGGKIREDSRDIVEATLPDRLRTLLDLLARTEERRELDNGHGAR